jgi:hypothetical protein
MKKYLLLIFTVFIFVIRATSQVTETGWLASFNKFTISSRFSIHFDAQWRSGDNYNKTQTVLLRPGLNYTLSRKIIVTSGYAFVTNRRNINDVSGYGTEHRIWEQLIIQQNPGIAAIQHRFRLEQRFISKSFVENGSFKNKGSIYANRFRYFFRTIVPLNGQKPFTNGLFGAIQDEIMFNVGDNSALNNKYFDQNRFLLSIGYRLNKKTDLEAGYMNQYAQLRGDAFLNNHIIQLAIYTRL